MVSCRSIKDAINDIISGLKKHEIWLLLGWYDIKLRYKRSLLGPLWITISIAVMIFSMGIIYGQLFDRELSKYLPYIGASLINWFFISTQINDSCNTFILAEAQIKEIAQPLSVYALRMLWRNIIIFLHNILVFVIIAIIFRKFNIYMLLYPVSMALICSIMFFINIILGLICTRFRDIPPIVGAIMQVLIFITPVFWEKEFLTKYVWVMYGNPAYHLLEMLRAPLLGYMVSIETVYVTLAILMFVTVTGVIMLAKYRNRLAYWV